MVKINKAKFFFYFCRIFPTLVITALFCCPLSMMQVNLYDSETPHTLLFPFLIPLIKDADFYAPILQILFYSVYFLPATVILLITSIFVKKISNKLLYYFVLVSLTLYLFCSISCMIICANTSLWFTELPRYIYTFFAFAVISHLALSITGITYRRINTTEYAEFKQLKNEEDDKKKKKISIKTKLTLSIIGAIAVILFSFMVLILRRYQNYRNCYRCRKNPCRTDSGNLRNCGRKKR